MIDPILVAATELKDAIENVYKWRDYLVDHLRDDLGLGHDKIINNFIFRLKEGASNIYEHNIDTELEYIEGVVNDVIKFEESENKK